MSVSSCRFKTIEEQKQRSYVGAYKSLHIDRVDDNLDYECSCAIINLFTVFKEHLVQCVLEVILGFKGC